MYTPALPRISDASNPISFTGDVAKEISYSVISRFFPSTYSKTQIQNEIKDRSAITKHLKNISLTALKFVNTIETFVNIIKTFIPSFSTPNLNSISELIAPKVTNLADIIDQFVLNNYGLSPNPSNKQATTGTGSLGGLGPSAAAGAGAATGAALATSNIQPGSSIDSSSISADIPKEGKAVLTAIAAPESDGAYNIVNYEAVARGAPKYFSDYSHHPFEGQKGYTAAGKYQILASNWEKYAPMAGVSDFSPASQDKVAWVFAQDVYSRQTGRNLVEDVKDPQMHQYIVSVLGGTWYGMRDNPSKSLAALQSVAREGDGMRQPPKAADLAKPQERKYFNGLKPIDFVQELESARFRQTMERKVAQRTHLQVLPIIVNN